MNLYQASTSRDKKKLKVNRNQKSTLKTFTRPRAGDCMASTLKHHPLFFIKLWAGFVINLKKFLWVLQRVPVRNRFVGGPHFAPMAKFFSCGMCSYRHATNYFIFVHDRQKQINWIQCVHCYVERHSFVEYRIKRSFPDWSLFLFQALSRG